MRLGTGTQTNDARDVDDGRAWRLAQQRNRRPRHQPETPDIDGKDAIPFLNAESLKIGWRCEDGDAGIIDQRIQTTIALFYPGQHRAHGPLIADIGLHK
jgi:hypothetical protein